MKRASDTRVIMGAAGAAAGQDPASAAKEIERLNKLTGAEPMQGALKELRARKDKGKALVDFVNWALDNGSQMATELYYAPLPDSLAAKVKAKISTIKY